MHSATIYQNNRVVMKNKAQPIQPLETDSNGTVRFRENAIVKWFLEEGRKYGLDMNAIACLPFPREDRVQFAQLIGYSLGGFGELPYVKNQDYEAAQFMKVEGQTSEQAQIAALTEKLDNLKDAIRGLTCEAFHIHPDDLQD